jgi:hypothetical protein
MYRDNKHLRLNESAHIFSGSNAVGYLRRTDLMKYVNTWKFVWLGVPYGTWGRLRQSLVVCTYMAELIMWLCKMELSWKPRRSDIGDREGDIL